MAELLGEEVGQTVGYAMRMDTRASAKTRILVVTESILSRMILDDPELAGVSAILFDEFHERSLDGDFGLALALDVQGALRPDLRLLVMSATIDGARVASLLNDAPVIESQGRGFPIDIRYQERPAGEPIEDAMAKAIRAALADEPGSVLAFLPGQREIERTAERLAGRLPENVDITPLYGMLDGRAQDAAIRPAPAGRRKIVLATSIAETSITIDGVRVVIDSGLARVPKFEPSTGLTRLETERVSRASADQRAGRAGRTEPGVAIRLWRAEQTAALPAFTQPEIKEADLSGLLLDCAAFGVSDPTTLAFLDPPPAPALAEARTLAHRPPCTRRGRPPHRHRLGHAQACSAGPSGAHGHGGRPARRSAPRRVRSPSCSPNAVSAATAPISNAASNVLPLTARPAPMRRGNWLRGWRNRLAAPAQPPPSRSSLGRLLIDAWPDRVAKARGERGRFVLANGRGAMLDPTDPLAGETFLVIADLQGKAQNARIAVRRADR